jgi:hypothetical protein
MARLWLIPAFALFVSVSAAADPQPSSVVRTLDGKSFSGQILSLSEQEVKLRVDGKEITLPEAQVIAVDLQPAGKQFGAPGAPAPAHLQVRLVDGTMLRCQAFALRGAETEVRLFSGLALKFPTRIVHYVLCEAHEEKNRADLEQLLAKKASQDQLRLLSRDGKTINVFEGIIGDADAKGETIQFRPDGGDPVTVALTRVRGIVFSRAPDEKAPRPRYKVEDLFQNTFVAATFAVTDDGYKLKTPAGLDIELANPLVRRIDMSIGKVAYLADLEPVRVEETPILADIWRYRRNTNLQGGRISLGGKTYDHGLAVHSRTVLEYDVTGFNHFRCVLGIDDSVTGPAHAVVRIEGDGKELYNQAVSGRDKPREIDLKITGCSRLRLIVDYGDDLDLGDHVDFADARVTK